MTNKPELIKGIEPAYAQIVALEVIEKMKSEYLTLKVTGMDDKEGLTKVHDARMTVRDYRIAIEKLRKELKAESLEYGRQVDAIAKKFAAPLEPIEAHLQAEEDKIENEKQRIKEAKEKAEAEKLQARINALAKYGAAHDVVALKLMDEDKFLALETECKKAFEEEQTKKAEEARKQKEEAEKISFMQKELEAEKKKVAEEQERIRKEQEAKEAEIRKQQEAIAEEKRQIEETKRLEEAKKEAAEKARIEEQERIEREQKANEERERIAKIEEEERKAQAPDKDKLIDFIASLEVIKFPEMKSKKYVSIIADTKNQIEELIIKLSK